MPAPIERGVMGAPQAHGISPLLAAAEKKQFKESSHYIPSDCLCEAFCPGRERASRCFCLQPARGNERANEGQNFCQLEIHAESFRRRRKRGGFECRCRRAQCSGIRGGMVTGLGTQRRLFSAQISPPTLYPGI